MEDSAGKPLVKLVQEEDSAGKPLLKLVQEGDLSSLEAAVTSLSRGPAGDVWGRRWGRSGDTFMHYAARHGHAHILDFLLTRCGVNVDAHNNDFKRPLHEAAASGQLQCVRLLLQRGAPVDSLKRADWTPLMMACTRRRLSIVQELLSHGADVHLKNKDGWSPFHIACREGSADVVLLLLQHSPSAWTTESRTARTPLHTAALHGCEDVVRILLERCEFRPDDVDSCGVTPLMDSLRNGNISVARLLLDKHKASPTAVDRVGARPVHQVAVTGQNEALVFLVKELKVEVNDRATALQLTPLHYAAKEGHTSTLLTLEALGADLHVQDAKGRTALHMASMGQHAEAVKALLTLGLKNCEDFSGTTPLQLVHKPAVVQAFQTCPQPSLNETHHM